MKSGAGSPTCATTLRSPTAQATASPTTTTPTNTPVSRKPRPWRGPPVLQAEAIFLNT